MIIDTTHSLTITCIMVINTISSNTSNGTNPIGGINNVISSNSIK